MTAEPLPLVPGLPGGVEYHARYQPIVTLDERRVVAYGASLSAWAAGVEIAPMELFRKAAEPATTAALDRLGRTTAIRGAADWLGEALLFVRLLPAMVPWPREALDGLPEAAADAGIPVRRIVVEVGLGQGRSALEHLARVVVRCRGAGCRVAVVDVGDAATIRNSASALVPDFIKLGRSLVAAAHDPAARSGVDRTVAAAHAVGSHVIAFGLETETQAAWAAGVGADWGQGWLFGRPRRRPPPPA